MPLRSLIESFQFLSFLKSNPSNDVNKVNKDCCAICDKKEDSKGGIDMITACECYKKSDKGRVHENCVRELLLTGDVEASNLYCPYCHEKYNLKIKTDIPIFKLFTFATLKAYCKFMTELLILICFTFSATSLYYDYDKNPKMVVIVLMLSIFTIYLSCKTLNKIYRKWFYNTADITIDGY